MHGDSSSPPSAEAPRGTCDFTGTAASDAENEALRQRRRCVLGDGAAGNEEELGLPRVGLALSGGGVRSATFALGLLRGMAQSRNPHHPGHGDPARRTLVTDGLLGRVDYVSSVSGGGYVAGMLGRLVSLLGLREAQQRLARSDGSVLQWLRRNGRYLTPSGSRDIGVAVVTFMRALLAIHFEFMFACICLGLLVVAPHLWQHTWQLLQLPGWEPWQTPWWPAAAALWLLTAPGLIAGYWAARDGSDAVRPRPATGGWPARVCLNLRDGLLLLIVGAGVCLALRSLHRQGALDVVANALTWPTAAGLALMSVLAGQVSARVWLALRSRGQAWSLAVALLRNRLTRALRAVSLAALALAGLGALDRLSWWVLEELQAGNVWLWGGAGVGGMALLVLRTLMQPLQQLAAQVENRAGDWLPRLLNIAGMVGLFVLVLAWLVALQWFVFAPDTFDVFVGVPAWMRAGLLAGVWALWVLLTAGNPHMANTSSLHSFYRARLTRAYLAVGNPNRSIEGDQAGQGRRPDADVTEVVEGDDTRLSSYQPETRGGPIHLVNACLNQTRDSQSGLYNADRKGCNVTASWRGIEVGRGGFLAAADGYDAGTLGRWVAVSGAAASPGAGSYTSRGLALLIYFLGVRLGLWVRSPHAGRPALRWLSRVAWRFMPKPLMLASEASATFFGMDRPWWYLSDGGHFENTGVYALLKRELDFIILSDASCDARYEFGDLENLVRKARIDFGAEIDFYTGEEAAGLFSLAGAELTVVSPEALADNHSCRGVLLARIRYRERPGPVRADGSPGPAVRPEGTLLVVKPNLHDELDVDVLAYAQKHADFPHESTGDQSFDEAQWESYHRLGEDFGRALHDNWLAQLPGWRRPARHGLKVAARLRHAVEPGLTAGAPKLSAEPLWKRSARATAIGTTLGVGATGTLLVSLWQLQDQLQRRESDEQAEIRQMLTDTSKGLQGFDGSCPNLPDHVAAQASRLLELRATPTLRTLEQGGVERIATRLVLECKKPPKPDSDCRAVHERLQSDLCTQVNGPPAQSAPLDYWRPGTSPGDQVMEASQAMRQWRAQWAAWLAGLVPPSLQTASTGSQNPASLPAPPSEAASTVVAVAAGPASSAAGMSLAKVAVSTAPPPSAAGPGASGAAPTQAAGEPGGKPAAADTAAAKDDVPRPVSLAATTLSLACRRSAEQGPAILYLQVYDDATQRSATQWRQVLLDLPGGIGLQFAPVENVTRGAELRQQRKPVAWPKPTFVLHDPGSRRCAEVLAGFLKARLAGPSATAAKGGGEPTWIRELPANLPNRRPGVIELWLPPGSLSEAKAAAVRVASAKAP